MPGREPLQETSELFAQALALQSAGQGAKARSIYEQVLATEPQHANALNNLGILLNGTGHSAQALALFDQLVAVEPKPPARTPTGVWH